MTIDLTHPLFYGYRDNKLAVFKRGNDFYDPLENAYATPGRYSNRPLLSGYLHKKNASRIPGSAGVFVHRSGRGKVIGLMDNPTLQRVLVGNE